MKALVSGPHPLPRRPLRWDTDIVRRIALVGAIALGSAITAAAPVSAGGSHLAPARDRYERGEVATLVGYTSGGQLGWVQDGPFFAYLVADDTTLWSDHRLPDDHVGLGPLSVQPRGRTLRVSITFLVPDHLATGLYYVTYCNDPCTTGLGDLIGGSLAVGVDPPRPVQRTWPPDEPEIANLVGDAMIAGPGYGMTAADARAGRRVEPPAMGPGSVQVRAPERAPAPAEPGPQAPGAPVAAAELPTRDAGDWSAEAVLVLMTAAVTLGAVMAVQRGQKRRLAAGGNASGHPVA